MSKVLIVEDDEILNAGLCYNLQKREITPYPAYTLEEAEKWLSEEVFDLILLDINLPDGDGFLFAKNRIKPDSTPYLFLTAHNLEEEIIQGYHLGAEDYITKPFHIKIVIEKILAILRRCEGQKHASLYVCGNLIVDFENRTVKKSGEWISLTPTEFDLLSCFCKFHRQILTKELLLESIWDNKGNFVNEHTLSLNISRLRSKIEDEKFGYIKTIYGVGYRWVEPGEDLK